jgi:hypothetical protein
MCCLPFNLYKLYKKKKEKRIFLNIFKMAITFFKMIVSKQLKKEKNGRNLCFLVVLFLTTCDIAMRNIIRRDASLSIILCTQFESKNFVKYYIHDIQILNPWFQIINPWFSDNKSITFKWSHYQQYIHKYPNTSLCCIQSLLSAIKK